ncbi:NAD(P) transhydrogenase subunit alpha [Rubricoccus marinus]|uniref:proton-translocating NAD(P)(+) transhydrogenase n=1 Tax=Rubricoccus marinus TaxID=716817 RepID=A0A259TWK7_9BACT|nr:NAD(P) transhydrogenase subunit alpha [Rubricoccus marinus]OZC01964.1 NAD(P) transhydrogenase subunit alpha [Rubricoccus marinus]
MALTIGVPRETAPGEARVALASDAARRLVRKGCEVRVEQGAGERAFISDADFEAAGCHIVDRAEALASGAVCTVSGLDASGLDGLASGAVVLGLLRPLDDTTAVEALAARGATAVAMEMVPRTSRAQRMDALSAMSTVSGYRAALLAAFRLPQFFPLLTTAAGTVRPARVLVIGAGVAGLQALATARRLGAITAGYDVRAAAREQVESVGASFVELDMETADQEDAGGYAKALAEDEAARQVEALAKVLPDYHVVITTALIPGRAAPVLITARGVAGMRPGSVIVDLAAANGGNVEATRADEEIVASGVTVLGPTNLAAEMPTHASEMYGRTVAAFLLEFLDDEGTLNLDPEDEIVAGAVVARDGEIVHPRVLAALAPA